MIETKNISYLKNFKVKVMVIITAITFLIPYSTHAELIRNGSFEAAPNNNTGEGLLPSDWQIISWTPDTYSVDGSYGLLPSYPQNRGGNFTGATAYDGLRWLAGWSNPSYLETFGQVLTSPLTPGETYQFSAYLRQAIRPDIAHAGSYEIALSDSYGNNKLVLGQLDWVSNPDSWENRTLTFVAPPNSDTRPLLLFTPIHTDAGYSYPGLDSVSLTIAIVEEPIRIAGPTPVYYSSLQAAYDDADDNDVIQIQAVILSEDLYIELNKSVTIEGGFDNDFIMRNSNTTLNGNIVISNGKLTIDSLMISN